MTEETLPEPDRIEGVPHPRKTRMLIGQGRAEAAFLEAFNAGRLHHGWLIVGPRGVGKATLAWRLARFLLATPLGAGADGDGLFGDMPPGFQSLDIAGDHPVAHRVSAGSDPGLYHITRTVNEKTGRLRDVIVAEDVRRLNQFLQLSNADGGRRVVILDCADEMNVQASNALLKMLEEPPARTVLLLVSHQPSGLLPTIRSRCRELRLLPLGPADMAAALAQAGIETAGDPDALAELSGGSVGEAVRLIGRGGLELYAELLAIVATMPQFDRSRALKLAESMAARGGAEGRFDLLLCLTDMLLARLARSGAMGVPPRVQAAPGEAQVLARLSPSPAKGRAWAECAQDIGSRLRHGRAVNLDPAALVLDTVFRIQQTAAG